MLAAEATRSEAPMGCKGTLWNGDEEWRIGGMDLEAALAFPVSYKRPKKPRVQLTLKDVAERDPLYLDELIGITEPGGELFYALFLVCQEYEWAVERAQHRQARALEAAGHGSHVVPKRKKRR